MNILLNGPLTGVFKTDWRIFKDYEDELRTSGDGMFNISNPLRVIAHHRKQNHDLSKPEEALVSEAIWQHFCSLRFCLNQLLFCDAIYLIPGLDICPFSIAVCVVAHDLGLRILTHINGELVLREFNLIAGDMTEKGTVGLKTIASSNKKDNDKKEPSNWGELIDDVYEDEDEPVRTVVDKTEEWFKRQFGGDSFDNDD